MFGSALPCSDTAPDPVLGRSEAIARHPFRSSTWTCAASPRRPTFARRRCSRHWRRNRVCRNFLHASFPRRPAPAESRGPSCADERQRWNSGMFGFGIPLPRDPLEESQRQLRDQGRLPWIPRAAPGAEDSSGERHCASPATSDDGTVGRPCFGRRLLATSCRTRFRRQARMEASGIAGC